MLKRVLLCTTLAFVSGHGAVFADSVRPAVGPVILARSGIQATYLWDASPYVAQLVVESNVGDTGLRALEGTAVSVLRDKAILSHAKILILRVVYTRSGAVSPVYKTLTFEGVEKLAVLSVAREAVVQHGAAWPQDVEDGRIPPDLKVEITGKLPPPL